MTSARAIMVRIWLLQGDVVPPGLPAGTCVYRLGNVDGTSVFLWEDRALRVPTQSILVAANRCIPQ